VSDAQGEIHIFFCLTFIETGMDNTDWYKALAAYVPESLINLWLFWVAEGLFESSAQQSSELLSKAVEQYQIARPDALGLVPFALFSVCLGAAGPLIDAYTRLDPNELEEGGLEISTEDLEYRFENPDYKAFYRSIEVLDAMQNAHADQINKDWLLASLHWIHHVNYSVEELYIGDLLEVFISLTSNLILAEVIPNTHASQNAIRYAEELIAKRGSLQNAVIKGAF
jgi:hypothetical protein